MIQKAAVIRFFLCACVGGNFHAQQDASLFDELEKRVKLSMIAVETNDRSKFSVLLPQATYKPPARPNWGLARLQALLCPPACMPSRLQGGCAATV